MVPVAGPKGLSVTSPATGTGPKLNPPSFHSQVSSLSSRPRFSFTAGGGSSEAQPEEKKPNEVNKRSRVSFVDRGDVKNAKKGATDAASNVPNLRRLR